MQFPSFRKITATAANTILRFPFSIASVLTGTVAFFICCEYMANYEIEETLLKTGFFCILAYPLFTSIVLFAESRNLNSRIKSGMQIAGLILLLVYYFTSPAIDEFTNQDGWILFMLILSAFLSLTFAPFLYKNQLLGFWQFNRKIISRICMAALFVFTLFAGLSLALFAIESLFDIHIRNKTYEQLFITLTGIFGMSYITAGIPFSFATLNEETTYPKGLKIFSRYILTVLIIVYMVILYLYAILILCYRELPEGWTSVLIITLSCIGILSFLFTWPLFRDKEKDSLISKFSGRYFFIALLPLLILLYVAIFRRINDYGVTPYRYYLIVIAGWITAMSCYFLFSKQKNIKIVTLSLCVLALLSCFGPWGAYHISANSQANRIKNILVKSDAFPNGRVDSIAVSNLSDSITVKINDILYELDNYRNGLNVLSKKLNKPLTSGAGDAGYYQYASKQLGLKHTETYYSNDSNPNYFSWGSYDREEAIRVSGYDYIFPDNYLYNSSSGIDFRINKTEYEFVLDNKKFLVYEKDKVIAEFPVNDYFRLLQERGYKNPDYTYSDEMYIIQEEEGYKEKPGLDFTMHSSSYTFYFFVNYLHGYLYPDSGMDISYMNMSILIKENNR